MLGAALVHDASPQLVARIGRTIDRFGTGAVERAASAGIRVIPLERGQQYRDCSASLARLGVDVDAWPAPPAGLFVVEERTMYLRSCSPMTIAHEFGHALDCALGEGIYRSATDAALERLFCDAKTYVTPYAGTSVDEYFAESMRAYVEVNDPASYWPRATRSKLHCIDPAMHAYIAQLFEVEFVRRAPALQPVRKPLQ